jgi:hypothetical protein
LEKKSHEFVAPRLRDERAIFYLFASKALLVFITVVIFIFDAHFGDVCDEIERENRNNISSDVRSPPIEGTTVTTTGDENCGEEEEGGRRDGIGGGIDQSAVDPVRGGFARRGRGFVRLCFVLHR